MDTESDGLEKTNPILSIMAGIPFIWVYMSYLFLYIYAHVFFPFPKGCSLKPPATDDKLRSQASPTNVWQLDTFDSPSSSGVPNLRLVSG